MASVSVVRLPEILVVASRVTGTVEALRQRVPAAWEALMARLPEVAHRVEPGVFFGLSSQGADPTGPEKNQFTSWVGVEVRAFEQVPEGLECLRVPAGEYVTTRVQGGREAVDAAALALFRWQRQSGRPLSVDTQGPERNIAYSLERYDSRRQRVMPPAAPFDHDAFKPLA
jgi:predicted transcriptional regulator YdeE